MTQLVHLMVILITLELDNFFRRPYYMIFAPFWFYYFCYALFLLIQILKLVRLALNSLKSSSESDECTNLLIISFHISMAHFVTYCYVHCYFFRSC